MRLRTTLLASLALAGVSLGGAAPLAAQELSRPDASASDQLQEVVVTAEKRSENILEVPISVSVIDGAALEKQHVQNFDSITRMTPGVSFIAGAGEGPAKDRRPSKFVA